MKNNRMEYVVGAFVMLIISVNLGAAEPRGIEQLSYEMKQRLVNEVIDSEAALDAMNKIKQMVTTDETLQQALLLGSDDAIIELCTLLRHKTKNSFRSLYLLKAYGLIDEQRYDSLHRRFQKEFPEEYKQQKNDVEKYKAEIDRFHPALIKTFITMGMYVNRLGATQKVTALGQAINKNAMEIIQLLLSHPGIDLNAPASRLGSSLHMAMLKKSSKLVKMLLADPRVDVNNTQSNISKTSPLHLAIKSLVSDPLIQESIMLLLADPRVDITLQDTSGNTALHTAIKQGYLDIIQTILQKESNVDLLSIKNNRGETPKMLAKQIGNYEILQLLETYEKKRASRE